jgi:hypothetical protein
MSFRTILAVSSALFVASNTGTARAETAEGAFGTSCLRGNVCDANISDIRHQGRTLQTELAVPLVNGRSVFISQIGDANVANVLQTGAHARVKVNQTGNRNEADITQRGSGTGYVASQQTGEGNFTRLQQDGNGQNVVDVTQDGNSNSAQSNQSSTSAVHNGARMTQIGNNNDMLLAQSGSDNLALLSQEGADNDMTAVQIGVGNRLVWTQQGVNLTDLKITQEGGAATGGQLQITQTGSGR